MGEEQGLGGRFDDGAVKIGRGGAWREAFLNRRRKSHDAEDFSSYEPQESSSRARSLSRPRATSRQPEPGTESFNQQAVLDQDRALIEQLTQRQQPRERSAVRKPPPPPKVTPYRTSPKNSPTQMDSPQDADTSLVSSQPPTPLAQQAPASPQRVLESATPQRQLDITPVIADRSNQPIPTETGILAAALASCKDDQSPKSGAETSEAILLVPSSEPIPQVPSAPGGATDSAAPVVSGTPALKPVVPRAGALFTASDIDAIMDSFGQSMQSKESKDGVLDDGVVHNLTTTFGNECTQFGASASTRGQWTQNFQDVADDFFKSHGMEVAQKPMQVPQKPDSVEQKQGVADASAEVSKKPDDFKIPERKKLREQIHAIDSWLEDDITARERLGERTLNGSGSKVDALTALPSANQSVNPLPGIGPVEKNGDPSSSIFQKLEEAKRLKSIGEKMSPVTLKNIAQEAVPLFPGMSLDALVRALRLFTSIRYEDHDLYLRILGEIPVQIRGISPEMLTTCVRVLWRLRLHEETYLELFSMETMNMIRAKRRPAPRAPRRPPALRGSDTVGSGSAGNAGPTPSPPMTAPSEVLAPFDAEQLINIGNALSRLGAKHPTRFMEVYQGQLSAAIPRLTQEECELVCPTLAVSQLMPDPLRRAFLERCAQVDAGKPFVAKDRLVESAAPDIAQYQQNADRTRRRIKNFRNIYVIEASVRKETFSFFSSLPAETRTYLDALHANAAQLEHEGSSVFASQVAAVLDQLGVAFETARMSGPLGLHVVAKTTNPRSECQEIVYECSDTTAFYRLRPEKGAVPELTAWSKIRHRLLQRLGVQLTHIGIWEWQQMSEAQRVNYMVKVQSLQ